MLTFARWALAIFDINAPNVRLGGVGLFEAFLEHADVPAAWRARIRTRFGHPEAMQRLMDRLANPDMRANGPAPDSRDAVIETRSGVEARARIAHSVGPSICRNKYLSIRGMQFRWSGLNAISTRGRAPATTG